MNVQKARAAAFAPGHVTGLFEIHDEASELARRGSRGAGFCLSHGAISYVEIEHADSMKIEIILDKAIVDAPVTRHALTELLRLAVKDAKIPLNKDAPKGARAMISVRVHTEHQLPISQGFGMSAAGALAASLALARCLRIGRGDAVRAAHEADVAERGGLGDVVGSALGGFEIRSAPGLPPYGVITNFVGYGDAVLCVVGARLETKRVLSDPQARGAVNAAGGAALAELMKAPSLDAFLTQSQRFARESKLANPDVERAMHAASPHGKASMAMLGNSVFAFGNTKRLVDALAPFGETWVVPVADAGARLAEIEP